MSDRSKPYPGSEQWPLDPAMPDRVFKSASYFRKSPPVTHTFDLSTGAWVGKDGESITDAELVKRHDEIAEARSARLAAARASPKAAPATLPAALPPVVVSVPIDSIVIGDRFRKHFEGIEKLAGSIKANGLLQAVGITDDNRLVFGHRRVLACKSIGWKHINASRVPSANALLAEHDENVVRQDFTASEKLAIAEALWPEVAAAAKERELAGVTASNPVGKSHRVGAVKTRDVVAAAVGLSAKSLKKVKAVVDAAKTDPIKYAGVADEMDRTGNVSAAYAAVTEPKQVKAEPAPSVAVGTTALSPNAGDAKLCSELVGVIAGNLRRCCEAGTLETIETHIGRLAPVEASALISAASELQVRLDHLITALKVRAVAELSSTDQTEGHP